LRNLQGRHDNLRDFILGEFDQARPRALSNFDRLTNNIILNSPSTSGTSPTISNTPMDQALALQKQVHQRSAQVTRARQEGEVVGRQRAKEDTAALKDQLATLQSQLLEHQESFESRDYQRQGRWQVCWEGRA
jgi:hypothetical protein